MPNDFMSKIQNSISQTKDFVIKTCLPYLKKTPMNLHTILIGLGLLGLLGSINVIFRTNKEVPKIPPVVAPPSPPYKSYIAASGIIEAHLDNIKVGCASQGGIVETVHVNVGDHVKANDPLFSLDSSVAQANYDLSIARANQANSALKQAQTFLKNSQDKYDIAKRVKDPDALSKDDFLTRENAYLSDLAAVETAKIAVEIAKADQAIAKAQLDQLKILSPEQGTILQVNIHPGEFATTNGNLIVLGKTNAMQVRLDIDESEAWRYLEKSKAVAFLPGNGKIQLTLTYDHIEPYVVPKTSLTGSSTEKVDTRVLQVIYRIENPPKNVYVGQQVDIYIDDSTESDA